jgi:hypothetical protein
MIVQPRSLSSPLSSATPTPPGSPGNINTNLPGPSGDRDGISEGSRTPSTIPLSDPDHAGESDEESEEEEDEQIENVVRKDRHQFGSERSSELTDVEGDGDKDADVEDEQGEASMSLQEEGLAKKEEEEAQLHLLVHEGELQDTREPDSYQIKLDRYVWRSIYLSTWLTRPRYR